MVIVKQMSARSILINFIFTLLGAIRIETRSFLSSVSSYLDTYTNSRQHLKLSEWKRKENIQMKCCGRSETTANDFLLAAPSVSDILAGLRLETER